MRSIIKKILKQILRLAGGFYMSRMRSDMEDVMSHLKKQGVYPKTVFDIGVADGTPDLYQAFSDSHFVLIEPLKEFERDMVSISSQYQMEYVVAAASDEAGSMTFNVHPDLCGSSMLQETEGAHVDGEARTVPTVRLDTLAKERSLEAPYLIKVDVQGGELKVLAGATGILAQTDAVILEVSLFGFFVGGPQFADIISAMKAYNFVVYEIFDARNRPLDGALAQVDILFVREDSSLRKHHSYANKEQREQQNKKIRRMMHQD
jgi:FkbM family methyltransferase